MLMTKAGIRADDKGCMYKKLMTKACMSHRVIKSGHQITVIVTQYKTA